MEQIILATILTHDLPQIIQPGQLELTAGDIEEIQCSTTTLVRTLLAMKQASCAWW